MSLDTLLLAALACLISSVSAANTPTPHIMLLVIDDLARRLLTDLIFNNTSYP